MIALIMAIGVGLVSSLVVTRVLISLLTINQMGQFIRQDGPESHLTKRGTPTMGGVAIIFSAVLGYSVAALYMYTSLGRIPKMSSVLVLGLMVAMGFVGFLDDFTKIRKEQSLGLTASVKMILMGVIGTVFTFLIINFPDENGITPASMRISFLDDFTPDFASLGFVVGVILFAVWINLIISAWTNAVNLTDGLDGLAPGVSIFAFAPYVVICFWQFVHSCSHGQGGPGDLCYNVRDPWDLTLVAGAILGALIGFLWWNTSPAKIFMGDTGSLALGGSFAAISILTKTELLAIIIGGVFVLETMSDVIQVGYFKFSKRMGWKKRRVFKMAPIHHHFELLGWKEHNVVVRFWLISALLACLGLGVFYLSWVQGMEF
ncbi:phospho-N-acetylmuramoyl-pentapeptide-transferase [Actinomycetota bacterium]|nr:phospho-N-acetylmuramoyl-pentapeptide-transferase [Actinomycetota bacterium]